MQNTLSATDVGAVVCCAGSAYLTPVIPIDADGIYSSTSSLPYLKQRLLEDCNS